MIRPIAICVIRNRNRILVFEAHDHVKHQTFYRPLGGGINFGEHAADAVARELREELGAAISAPKYLATLENIFTLNGQPRHELVWIYEASLLDAALYHEERLVAREEDGNTSPVSWMPIEDFRTGRAILYPDGLLDLLPA